MDLFGLLELQIPCSELAVPGAPERLYDSSRTLAAGLFPVLLKLGLDFDKLRYDSQTHY
jgi:hypothetical protein